VQIKGILARHGWIKAGGFKLVIDDKWWGQWGKPTGRGG
jgi:hypothetical protein